MKINCIIVEDEPKAMYLMEEYVKKTAFLQLKGSFYTSIDAISFLDENPDIKLLFLDINLPEMTGYDMAKVINPSLKIIFTTAHSEFAVDSYEVNTVDYLLKPVTYTRFLQAVIKVKNSIMDEKKSEVYTTIKSQVFLKSGRKIIQLDWDDIFYIEAMKEYLSVVTKDQKILIYKRMGEFEMMQPENFKRVHNSYIVNVDKIEKVEDNMVYLNKREIPIGKSYKDQFFEMIKNKLF